MFVPRTLVLAACLLLNACVQPEELLEPAEKEYDSFSITAVTSIQTQEDANPEIVRMIPGSLNQAVAVSSASKTITLLTYTSSSLEATDVYFFLQDDDTAELTSIDISPDGATVAIMVAKADCAKGSVILSKHI